MTKEELKQYLIDEADKSPSQVEKMDSFELLNAWLIWNGICGFTNDIIEVYKAAFDNNNSNTNLTIEQRKLRLANNLKCSIIKIDELIDPDYNADEATILDRLTNMEKIQGIIK